MSKKRVKLEEAKEILESEKVFFNGENKFNYVDIGKYKSGMTLVIPQDWNLDIYGNPEEPMKYIECKELTNGMNIDFDGSAKILLGDFRISQSGKPVFEIKEPLKAKDALIRVSWGGAFNTTRGQSSKYAKEVGAKFFNRKSSNGGAAGNDYWVVPVGFVRDREERDVKEILVNIQKSEDERIEKIDERLKIKEEIRLNSINNRERIINEANPIIDKIKEYSDNFTVKYEDEYLKYGEGYISKSNYSDDVINKLEEILSKLTKEKEDRDKYTPIFDEMKEVAKELNLQIDYGRYCITVKSTNSNSFSKDYNYERSEYNKFIEDLSNYSQKLKEAEEEARVKALKLKQERELLRKKEIAKEKGYPEEFVFWNRKGGATNLSHAYVIDKEGYIREPDQNELRNNNHKYKYKDWLNNADGFQKYNQILDGEVIVSYTKSVTATPYVLNVEWADDEASEDQLKTIVEELDFIMKSKFNVVDNNDNEIEDIERWAKESVLVKSLECKKQLKISSVEHELSRISNQVSDEECMEAKKVLIEIKEKEENSIGEYDE